MDDYEVLFNILSTSFNGWGPVLVAGAALVLAVGIWAIDEDAGVKVMVSLAGGLVAFFALVIGWSSWLTFQDLQSAFRDGHVESARGVVHYTEHGKFDRFSLEGHAFEFGPGGGAGGFNQTTMEDGPNLEGQCALIFYEPRTSAVVWLGLRKSRCDAPDATAPALAHSPSAPQAAPPPRT